MIEVNDLSIKVITEYLKSNPVKIEELYLFSIEKYKPENEILPVLHKDVYKNMCSSENVLIQAPRCAGKTTIIKNFIFANTLIGNFKNVLIVSANEQLKLIIVKDVINRLNKGKICYSYKLNELRTESETSYVFATEYVDPSMNNKQFDLVIFDDFCCYKEEIQEFLITSFKDVPKKILSTPYSHPRKKDNPIFKEDMPLFKRLSYNINYNLIVMKWYNIPFLNQGLRWVKYSTDIKENVYTEIKTTLTEEATIERNKLFSNKQWSPTSEEREKRIKSFGKDHKVVVEEFDGEFYTEFVI